MKKILLFFVSINLIFIILACSSKKEADNEILSDYRPMIYVQNSLYGETGDVVDVLPNDMIYIGAIESIVSQNEPMRLENFTSNTLSVGSEIYTSKSNSEVIYVKLLNSDQVRYSIYVVIRKMAEQFGYIDQNSVDDEAVNEAMIMLRDYLSVHELTIEDIENISQNIKVFEKMDMCIIEYKQTPEWYGNSGRSSWKILKYKENNPLIIFEAQMPLALVDFKLIETEHNTILLTYNENYESNHRKIQLFVYKIDGNEIQKLKSLNKINLESEMWMIDENQGLIWNKNAYNVYIESIAENGDLLIKSIDDQGCEQEITFILNEASQYELQ